MNRALLVLLLVFAFGVQQGMAAETGKTTTTSSTSTANKIDPNALQRIGTAGNATMPVYGASGATKAAPSPGLTATAPPLVAEGNSIHSSVTVQAPPVPACSDYAYDGPNVRPASGGPTGYRCPPGYSCHRNGILKECRYETELGQAPTIPSNSPACAYEPC